MIFMNLRKKGQMTLSQLPNAVIIFVVAIIVTAIMATVIANIQATQCGSGDNLSTGVCEDPTYAYNISGAGLSAADTLSDFFDPIAVIIAAVIIIGLILGAFILTRGGRPGGV